MKLKKIIGLLCFMILLTSCSKITISQDKLKSPDVHVEHASIMEILRNSNSKLTVPVKGELKSFYNSNLIGNDSSETVVLTRVINSYNEAASYFQLGIYSEEDDRAYSLVDLPLFSLSYDILESINKIHFLDITGDKIDDIIVEVNLTKSDLTSLIVISYDGGIFRTFTFDYVASNSLQDHDKDGTYDFTVLRKLENEKKSDSKFLLEKKEFNNSSFEDIYAKRIDKSFTNPQIYSGQFSKDLYGIFVHDFIEYREFGILCYTNSESRFNEGDIPLEKEFKLGSNSEIIDLRDINGDGIMEVGIISPENYMYDLIEYKNISEIFARNNQIHWTLLTDGLNEIVSKEYVNSIYNFTVDLDDYLKENVIVEIADKNEKNIYRRFSFYKSKARSNREFLFEIIVHKNNSILSDKNVNYLGKNNVYRFSYKTADGFPHNLEEMVVLEENLYE